MEKLITKRVTPLLLALVMLFTTGLTVVVSAAELDVPINIFDNSKAIAEKSITEKLVKIPANPNFKFAKDLFNKKGQGEFSPINDEYYLSKYLTTNAEYKEFLADTGSKSYPKYWTNNEIPSGKENHPVLWISYNQAEEYCKWLDSKYPDWDFRLPTEAEYENASIENTGNEYVWGNDSKTSYSNGVLTTNMNYNGVVAAYCLENFGDYEVTYNNKNSTRYNEKEKLSDIISISENGGVKGWVSHNNYTGFIYTDLFSKISSYGGYTSPVNYYQDGVNEYGLYDMCGNAYSWTSSLIEAVNGAEKGRMVNAVRGGSWYATVNSCKATFRGEGRKANSGYSTIGFRVAATKKTRDDISSEVSTNDKTIIVLQINNSKMSVNGKQQEIDLGRNTVPVIKDGRTILPVRAVVEVMGGRVSWNNKTQTSTLSCGDNTVMLTIGRKTALLNNAKKALDVEPVIINERTMLPIRFIAESFGLEVKWNKKDETITISESDNKSNGKKILVAYFSCTGTTKSVAEAIVSDLDADIYEIVPQTPYTEDDLYWKNDNSRALTEQRDTSSRPIISNMISDISSYTTVFIGYPIWKGQAPRIISTFLEGLDFSGKTIIPFCTSGASDIGSSDENLYSLCSENTNWIKGQRFGADFTEAAVAEWLKKIKVD